MNLIFEKIYKGPPFEKFCTDLSRRGFGNRTVKMNRLSGAKKLKVHKHDIQIRSCISNPKIKSHLLSIVLLFVKFSLIFAKN
jgi:hypothetical protein